MAVTLIPYGQLADGKYGIKLNDTTGEPIAAALEVIQTLPAALDPDNFQGRLMYEIDTDTLFVYQAGALNDWFPLEGIPAEVGPCGGTPPITGTEQVGFLFFCTDTEIMFVWDGAAWQAIGGRFAARYLEQKSISTGFAGPGGDTFALGTVPVFAEFVEVYLDGIRQVPNPAGDYNVIGSNAVFPAPVPVGVEVFTRTLESTVLESPALLQNAQCIAADFNNQAAGVLIFDIGAAGLDPACTMVYRNGLLIQGGGLDYVFDSVDTTITGLTQLAGTATAVCLVNHFANIGDVVTIVGAAEADYNGTKTITDVPLGNTFEYAINPAAPATATQADISVPISYSPPLRNDQIILAVATLLNDDITIRSFQRIVTAPSTGEANDGTNLGGGVEIFAGKASVNLQFNTLVEGPNIQINPIGSTIQIATTAGSTFEGYVFTNTNVALASTESYIGVDTSGGSLIIDVSTVSIVGTAGRRVVITDETGDAGTNPINITHAGRFFNGAPSPLLINVDFGSVTIVFDGDPLGNWHIVAKTF